MFFRFSLFQQRRTENQLRGHYREVDRESAVIRKLLIVSICLLVVFGAFWLWVRYTNKPNELLLPVGYLISLVGFLIAKVLLNRCPQCKTLYWVYGNEDKPGRTFVVCESCKTFIRDVEAD
jgi:hypothetical protein